MSNIEKAKKPTLPKLADIVKDADKENLYHNDIFNALVCQPPPAKWVQSHPFIQGHRYLPIDKIEFLLRKIFREYRIEITGQGTSFNGVYVTVRVHYKHPISGEWNFHDGIGSIQLQTKKGSSPADLANINNGALSMAFPLAKTLAVKDACDHFGDLFGANLNRKDVIAFTPDEQIAQDVDRAHERRLLLIANCTDLDELDQVRREVGGKYIEQINQRKTEIIDELSNSQNTSISYRAIDDRIDEENGDIRADGEEPSDRDLFGS